MSQAANLLRAYAKALDEAKTPHALRNAEARFWGKRGGAVDSGVLSPMADILKAHTARVLGASSPAACDRALSDAIRSLGT